MLTVLLAEDAAELREALEMRLLMCGYKVVAAQNGMEALRLFKAIPEIRAVITDLEMPMMNGVQLAHEIRLIDKGIPIIMQSGSDDPKSRDIDVFIPKGDPKPIFVKLKELLEVRNVA